MAGGILEGNRHQTDVSLEAQTQRKDGMEVVLYRRACFPSLRTSQLLSEKEGCYPLISCFVPPTNGLNLCEISAAAGYGWKEESFSALHSGSRVGTVSGTYIVLQSCMVTLGFRCDHPHVLEEAQRDEGAAQGHTAYTDGVAI